MGGDQFDVQKNEFPTHQIDANEIWSKISNSILELPQNHVSEVSLKYATKEIYATANIQLFNLDFYVLSMRLSYYQSSVQKWLKNILYLCRKSIL